MKRWLWCIAIWDILSVRNSNTATPNSVHYSVSESATTVIYKAEFVLQMQTLKDMSTFSSLHRSELPSSRITTTTTTTTIIIIIIIIIIAAAATATATAVVVVEAIEAM